MQPTNPAPTQTINHNPAVQCYAAQFPMLASALSDADHVDVKNIEARATLREFVAGAMSYQPGWMTFLYRVRAVFVRFLGMKQEGVPSALKIRPEDLPMTPGKYITFFKVTAAEEDHYICMAIKDKHLTASLAVVAEPLTGGTQRFYGITIVHYHNWAGPIYFNVIRPFHHLVVRGMMRAGAARQN